MAHMADVDIDTGQRDNILNLIKHTPATLKHDKKHNSGVYIQPIPINPLTKNSSLTYKDADERGYFKLDILNVNIYTEIKDSTHYEKLMSTTPPWEKLQEKDFVEQLVQINNQYDLLNLMKPDSIPRMAMFIAVMRPGKSYLRGRSWDEVSKTVWKKEPKAVYSYKKSHAIAYATLIALHMNIINE